MVGTKLLHILKGEFALQASCCRYQQHD